MQENTHFILGADDPEMSLIETGLRNAQLPYSYAAVDGRRVAPFNAYKASDYIMPDQSTFMMTPGMEVVTIECSVPDSMKETLDSVEDVTKTKNRYGVIDHHRPGDPGYGQPPEKYWEASSIGQFWMMAEKHGWKHGLDEKTARLAAAADHCLGAAYRGECPGISIDDLMDFRIKTKAAFQRVDESVVRGKINKAVERVNKLKKIDLHGQKFLDATEDTIPELPEALAITNQAAIYTMTDARTGKTKVGVLNGDETQVAVFMQHMRTYKTRVEGVYGDPAHGFAGGYLKDQFRLDMEGKKYKISTSGAVHELLGSGVGGEYTNNYLAQKIKAGYPIEEIKQHIKDHPEDVSRIEANGRNIAHSAVEFGRRDVIHLLRDLGHKDLFAKPDMFGRLPISEAFFNRDLDMAKETYQVNPECSYADLIASASRALDIHEESKDRSKYLVKPNENHKAMAEKMRSTGIAGNLALAGDWQIPYTIAIIEDVLGVAPDIEGPGFQARVSESAVKLNAAYSAGVNTPDKGVDQEPDGPGM